MKKRYLFLPLLLFSLFLFLNPTYAREEAGYEGEDDEVTIQIQEVEDPEIEEVSIFTMEEVEQHNTPDDCWMVFEDKVYDFSEYLPDHDEFMDIREWCGTDMTDDFRDKAGAGRDHRSGSYEMLEEYFIGMFADYEMQRWPQYTMEEVEQHNTPDDCWMVFENNVYDFSDYLPNHDRFMDIREWCGMDMTEDFRDKAGVGRDHRPGSYDMLAQYKIGELMGDYDLIDAEIILDRVEEEEVVRGREYNILIPFVLTTVLYWGMYFLVKADKFFGINIHKYNAFWNTILLLLLLIPGMAFGIFMMVRTKRPELWNIDFDFMYWHVELSLVMGFVAIYHFIQRIPQYLAQMKRRK